MTLVVEGAPLKEGLRVVVPGYPGTDESAGWGSYCVVGKTQDLEFGLEGRECEVDRDQEEGE